MNKWKDSYKPESEDEYGAMGPSCFKTETKEDWCHMCGRRQEIKFFEVWFAKNAEHDRNKVRDGLGFGSGRDYRRICAICCHDITKAIGGPK